MLLDRLIHDQISWSFKNIINQNQYGFQSGRSAVTNLMFSLENDQQVDSMYTDFSKDFAMVDLQYIYRIPED